MKRLEEIPVWLFALLTVAAFDALALGGLLCTRRWGRWLGLYALVDNNTVGWILRRHRNARRESLRRDSGPGAPLISSNSSTLRASRFVGYPAAKTSQPAAQGFKE